MQRLSLAKLTALRKSYLNIILVFSLSVFYLFLPFNRLSFTNGRSSHLHEDSVITITITAVGDIMCHSVQFNYARAGKDSFDFNPVYREIKKYLIFSDFLFGNFETVTAGKSRGYSGYPFFNTPDAFVAALKNAGFGLLTTSNNHALDRGEKGLLRTIELINKYGLNYNGTFSSQRDRDSLRIFNIKGIKIAFLAYTYGTNGNPVPKEKPYVINLIDLNLVERDIGKARAEGADIVLVHYHFGEEYQREPSDYQKDIVRKTIKYGADIIIGGHPHVIQPADFFKTSGGGLDTGFVIYSMGNFISNQRWRYSDGGVILNINLSKDFRNDSVFISGVTYIPTWVFKGTGGKGPEYVIYPLLSGYKSEMQHYFSYSDLKNSRQAFEDTEGIFAKCNRIKLFEKENFISNIMPRGFDNLEVDSLIRILEPGIEPIPVVISCDSAVIR